MGQCIVQTNRARVALAGGMKHSASGESKAKDVAKCGKVCGVIRGNDVCYREGVVSSKGKSEHAPRWWSLLLLSRWIEVWIWIGE